MAIGLTTGFTQMNSSPGLRVTINAGHAVINGSVVLFPKSDISLPANSFTYIYLNFNSGAIEQSQVGFLAGSWPICIAHTNATDCQGVQDLRPDAAIVSGGSPGSPSGSVQYNNAGVFAGDSNLTWHPSSTADYLSIGTITGSNDNLLAGSTPSVLTVEYPSAGTQADIIEIHSPFGIGLSIFAHSSLSYQEPQVTFYRSRGTRTSPTVVQAGDTILGLVAAPYTGTAVGGNGPFSGYLGAASTYLSVVAEENMSPTAAGSYFLVQTTAPGTANIQNTVEFHALRTNFYNRICFQVDNTKDIGVPPPTSAGNGRPARGYFAACLVGGVQPYTPSSGSIVVDCNKANTFIITVNAAITSFITSNQVDGQVITLVWEQDATGHAVSGITATFHGITAPPTTPNSVSAQSFVWDNTAGAWQALGPMETGGALDAARIATGTFTAAQLGSGTPTTSSYLRGDQTWATLVGGPVGNGVGDIQFNNGSGGLGGSAATANAAGTLVSPAGQVIGFNNGSVPSSVVASGAANTHGTNPVTLNTTGATLLIVGLCGHNADATITDSKSNTWTYLTSRNSGTGGFVRIAYVLTPTVGSGHTFTVGGPTFASAVVFAFAGSTTTFDVQNGNNGPATSPFQPGSITPTANDLVFAVCGSDNTPTTLSIDSGFATPVVFGSTDEGGGVSYLTAASGSALNPTWTATGGTTGYAAAIACFKVTAVVTDTAISRDAAGVLDAGNGSAGDKSATLKLGNTVFTVAAPTVAAAQVGLGSTTAATATAGGGQAVPATVLGYLIANVAGTAVKIPYFST